MCAGVTRVIGEQGAGEVRARLNAQPVSSAPDVQLINVLNHLIVELMYRAKI